MPENPIYLIIEQRLVCIIFSKVWSIYWVFISHSWPVLLVGYGGTPSEMASTPCLEGPLSKPKHTVREHLKNKPKMSSIQINPDLWYLGIWIPTLESGIKNEKHNIFRMTFWTTWWSSRTSCLVWTIESSAKTRPPTSTSTEMLSDHSRYQKASSFYITHLSLFIVPAS